MKKQSFILHFLLFFAVFLYCFIPPIFAYQKAEPNFFPDYSYLAFLLSLLWSAVCLSAVYNQKYGNSSFSSTGIRHFVVFASIKFQIKFRKCIKHYKQGILTLLLLFASGFITHFFTKTEKVLIPQKTPLEWILFFALTCFFASAEEVLYRYYLPRTLKFFLNGIYRNNEAKSKTFLIETGEFFAVLLFALAHRYLGITAIIHAFISGALLRWNIKKTDTLISVCLIHSLYNCLIFAFYLL